MKSSQILSRNFLCRPGTWLTIFSTLLIAACSSHSSGPSHPSGVESVAPLKVSALPEKAQSCEAKIREKMVNRTLHFDAISGLDGYAERANQMILSLGNPDFQLRVTKGSITSAAAQYSRTEGAKTERLSYELSLNPKILETPMSLSLSWKIVDVSPVQARIVTLNQTFQISTDCQSKLSKTSKESISPKASSASGVIYREKIKSVTFNGEAKMEAQDFVIPRGFMLSNLLTDLEQSSYSKEQQLSFMPSFGLVGVRYIQKAALSKTSFSRTFNFEGSMFDEYIGNRFVSHAFSGHASDAGGARYFEAFGSQLWTLPLAVWSENALGVAQSSNLVFKISMDYLHAHDSYIVLTNQKPMYDHIGAYFDLNELPNQDGQNKFNLHEKTRPTLAKSAAPEDLVSNETIQTQLPKIQAIKRAILKIAPHDRSKQIALILNYLKKHYSPDHEMETRNTIHPLTTAEALARGKGVCQHYSVIFTALARALGIPTRIVVGFFMTDDGPVADAWVESEVTRGFWQVLEPQNPNALTETQTRYYFPLMRGTMFEDKNVSSNELNLVISTGKFSFLPNP